MRTTPEGVKSASWMNCSFFRLRFFSVISQTSKLTPRATSAATGPANALPLRVLRAFHQEVDAVGVRDHGDLRGRVDVEVVADVAQALERLRGGVVDVVDDLVLRRSARRRRVARTRRQAKLANAHGGLL